MALRFTHGGNRADPKSVARDAFRRDAPVSRRELRSASELTRLVRSPMGTTTTSTTTICVAPTCYHAPRRTPRLTGITERSRLLRRRDFFAAADSIDAPLSRDARRDGPLATTRNSLIACEATARCARYVLSSLRDYFR